MTTPPDEEKVELTVHEMIAMLPDEVQDTIQQMAVFENAVDHQESGTPSWENLPTEAHDIYLLESYRRIMMLITLGWRPVPETMDDYVPSDMPAPEDMDI